MVAYSMTSAGTSLDGEAGLWVDHQKDHLKRQIVFTHFQNEGH